MIHIKFDNIQVWGFEHAIHGMRNPKESYDKSDSRYETYNEFIKRIDKLHEAYPVVDYNYMPKYMIGDNDIALAQKLIKAGAEHRKFMRQIFVSMDITAPMYWWSEFDTYKVGTVANSTSKMHTIQNKPITID